MAASALDALADSALSASNQVEAIDDRSSSLSELEDGLDEEEEELQEDEDDEQLSDAESHVSETIDDIEVGSETETERLDITPRRFSIANMDPLAALVKPDKTPSKLTQELTIDEQASPQREGSVDSSSSSSRKRKRGASEASSISDVEDDLRPLPKRASLRSPPRIIPQRDPSPESEEEPERPEEEPLDDEEDVEVEDAGTTTAPAEEEEEDEAPVAEDLPVAIAPVRRGRKPKRKGRQQLMVQDEITAASELSEAEAAEQEDAQEEALDEEDIASLDEEVTRRKAAIEAFSHIEKLWARFREVQVTDQLQRIESEIDLLERSQPIHPEFVAQMHCIDARRDEKIRYEDRLLGYDIQAVRVRTVAERNQLHSQYFQACRELKDDAFEIANREYYALQNERRRYGAIDSNKLLHFNPNRPVQVKQQSAYNLEVSILSGMAKYEGFPAAPEMKVIPDADINSDLLAMGITTAIPAPAAPTRFAPPVQQPFAVVPIPTEPESAPTDSQFFEQNPWANPPAHHAGAVAYTYHNFQAPSYLVTPVPSRKLVEHGSASTLEMPSNPPSSAAKAGIAASPQITHRENPPKAKGKGSGKASAAARAQQASSQPQPASDQPDGRIITTHNSSALLDQSPSNVYTASPYRAISTAPPEPIGLAQKAVAT